MIMSLGRLTSKLGTSVTYRHLCSSLPRASRSGLSHPPVKDRFTPPGRWHGATESTEPAPASLNRKGQKMTWNMSYGYIYIYIYNHDNG